MLARDQREKGNPHSWNATLASAHQKIEDEMRRMKVRGFVVSMSPRHKMGSPDPGVAVWWSHPPKKPGDSPELRVIACDKYDKAEVNLYAIGLSFDRLRALERYGAYTLEQAVEGARAALPPPEGMAQINWRVVLGDPPAGIAKDDGLAIMNARYRRKAADANGDEAELRRLNLAVEAARKEFGA